MTVRAIANLPDKMRRTILQKKKELDSYRTISGDAIKRIEEKMQVEYVYNSNKIEGSELNRGETALVLRGMTVKHKSLGDVLAAQNHPHAMEIIREMAFDPRHKISESDLKNIHLVIADQLVAHPGEYRQYDVSVAGAGFTPPPYYEISQHIAELLQFINENPDELTPIELGAHAHYHLAWIHAFEDGNGRMARLLLNFILVRNKYPFVVIKSVERKKYIECLRLADNGDFAPFLHFIAMCALQTLNTYLIGIRGTEPGQQFQTLTKLAKGTPYSAEYLSLLARKGVIDAVKEGKTWKTTQKTVDTYIEQHGVKTLKPKKRFSNN
jgi:Fic family protein